MGDDEKQAEIDRKKAEVRARLEAQAAGKKAKKGFMTPERKKKLRVSGDTECGIHSVLMVLFILASSEKKGCRGTEKRTGKESSREKEGH